MGDPTAPSSLAPATGFGDDPAVREIHARPIVGDDQIAWEVATAGQAAADFSALVFPLGDHRLLGLRAALMGGVGVAIALFIPRIGTAAFAILATAIALVGAWRWLAAGWARGWQRTVVWLDEGQRNEIAGLVPDAHSPAALARLLLATGATGLTGTPAADPYARFRILVLLGRDGEACAMADDLPDGTPTQRHRRALAFALREWRATGVMDLTDAHAVAETLEPAERAGAQVLMAAWDAIAATRAAGVHGPMATVVARNLPPPPPVRLSGGATVRLWRLRLWPLEWTLAAFAVAAAIEVLAGALRAG